MDVTADQAKVFCFLHISMKNMEWCMSVLATYITECPETTF